MTPEDIIKDQTKSFEQELDIMVRDFCTIGYGSKSEVRRRIINYAKGYYNAGYKQGREEVKQEFMKAIPEFGIKWMQEGGNKDHKGFTKGFNTCREQIINNLTSV